MTSEEEKQPQFIGPQSLQVENPYIAELIDTANKIATPGKGLLASDESMQNIGGKFASINLENNEENRRRYRELLYTTNGIQNYISGVIMNDETINHKNTKGDKTFIQILNEKGIIVGVKVDQGTRVLPFKPNESYTHGEVDLNERCSRFYKLGARFAKWRCTCKINEINGYISTTSIKETALTLSKYALICQINGLVPIIEPELLMDGNHNLKLCQYWTEKILKEVYTKLNEFDVILEGTLLKPNMCLPGNNYIGNRTNNDIANSTIQALKRTVPVAVPGILFLSGGQSEEEATQNLNAINKNDNNLPWIVSFSFGRALQKSCVSVWKGDDNNRIDARKEFLKRAKANSEAQLGKYTGDAQTEASKKSLYVKGYSY